MLTMCRPVGTQRALRVTPPNEALLFVVCAPVGPYYPKGFKPVALHATTEFIRAAPGGRHPNQRYMLLGISIDQFDPFR